MTTHILISGTINRAPEQRMSRNNNAFVTASVRVVTGNASEFWRVFAFHETAQAELLHLGEGDAVSCQGTPKFEIYAPDNGAARVSLSMTVDRALALRQPPKAKAKKETTSPPARSDKPASDRSGLAEHGCNGDDPFNDQVPF
jgi:single-stranded DNA-binding protein